MKAFGTHRPSRFGGSTKIAIAIAAVGLAAAACGGSSGGSSTAGNTLKAKAAAGGGSSVTVSTRHGPLGTYLVDGKGRTLYVFAADKGSMSTCTGSCAQYWPPVITSGSAHASGGAAQSKLGTSKRPDNGKTQVTYAGHPVYYYVQDSKAGQTGGQGLNISGGLWWIVAPSGASITGTSSSSSGSGGGYGG